MNVTDKLIEGFGASDVYVRDDGKFEITQGYDTVVWTEGEEEPPSPEVITRIADEHITAWTALKNKYGKA